MIGLGVVGAIANGWFIKRVIRASMNVGASLRGQLRQLKSLNGKRLSSKSNKVSK